MPCIQQLRPTVQLAVKTILSYCNDVIKVLFFVVIVNKNEDNAEVVLASSETYPRYFVRNNATIIPPGNTWQASCRDMGNQVLAAILKLRALKVTIYFRRCP